MPCTCKSLPEPPDDNCPVHGDPWDLTPEQLITAFDDAIRDPNPEDETRYESVGEELLRRLQR